MATIALVDDDRNILTSVSIALESEGYRVETYTDGASALEGLAARPPNLAILDIKMPRMDGMELLRRMRQKTDLPVIFLTSKDDEIDELFGLKMGADDFIRKPFSQRLLVERVKAVLRRASAREAAAKAPNQQAKSLERGQLVMDQERHTCTWKGEPVTLTVTEFLILHSLAQRPGVVKSRDALMDSAYDEQVYVDDRTIDSHIKRLRKKFKAVDDDFEMIETLYGVGLPVSRGVSLAGERLADGHGSRDQEAGGRLRKRPLRLPTAFLSGLTVPLQPLPRPPHLFQPDAAHPLPQPRRARRAGRRHPLPQPVPRRADRGARREPDDAGRDHRRRDRRLGDGRDRFDQHRSGKAARAAGRRKPGARLRPARQPRFPDQSRARRAGAAAADLADPHARPHLRPRRQSAARFAPSLFARPDPALRPAAGRRGRARRPRHASRSSSATSSAAPTCRSTRSSRAATARPIPR